MIEGTGAPATASRVRIPLLLVAVWCAVYAVRPFTLGFYHDDWSALLAPVSSTASLSVERFSAWMGIFANRPVTGVVGYLVSLVAATSAFRWHCLLAVLMLGTAVAIRCLLARLLEISGGDAEWGADAGAAAWLVFPWMLGATAWPVLGISMASTAAFALAGATLLARPCLPPARSLVAIVLFLTSILAYESFYGGFAALLILLAAAGAPFRRLWALAGGLLAAQVAAIVFNRLAVTWFPSAPHKQLDPKWFELLVANLRAVPHLLGVASPELRLPLQVLAAALVIAWLATIGAKLLRGGSSDTARRLLVIAAVSAGGVTALAVMAAAGYGITARGVFSRTTLGLSLWLAAGVAIVVADLAGASRRQRRLTAAAVLAVLALLGATTLLRLRDWSEAWRVERSILETAPVAGLAALPAGAPVLMLGPTEVRFVTVFSATWDLDAAMKFSHPGLGHLRFVPAVAEWATTWDGTTVLIRNTKPILELRAASLWLWRTDTAELVAAVPPWRFPGEAETAGERHPGREAPTPGFAGAGDRRPAR